MSDEGEAASPLGSSGGFGSSGATSGAMSAASREKADAFLDKQSLLADLQMEQLRLANDSLEKQDEYELSHLQWRRFNDQMHGMLQMLLVVAGLVVVSVVGTAFWYAADDHGLIVEPFSVPPDFAQKGLTGQVVAIKILDRLTSLQSQTVSSRASASYENNWGDDIKVQIPDTGVSIGEFNRYLHQWLGHATHITGEVYRTPTGIAISARAGSASSLAFTGSDAEFDKLIDQAAKQVYRKTQPYRYAIYLYDHNRIAENIPLLQRIIETGSRVDRAWAYVGLAADAMAAGDVARDSSFERKAIATDPIFTPFSNLVSNESMLQHDEQALVAARGALDAAARGDSSMTEQTFVSTVPLVRGSLALLHGDFGEAFKAAREGEAVPDYGGSLETSRETEMQACGSLHDATCLRAASASLESASDPYTLAIRAVTLELADVPLQRWGDILKLSPSLYSTLFNGKVEVPYGAAPTKIFAERSAAPLYAIAAAHMGDFATAHRMIDTTPPDCVLCMRAAGQVDAAQKNWQGAAYWFSRAVRAAPSVPFAYTDWGAMLTAKGDLDGAIAEFKLAHVKGPHFADPLEMWGEVLMRENHSDVAIGRFEEANSYAPHWGRLHLKWGEALVYTGRKDDAQKQFETAGDLDLTPSEKSELARMRNMRG
jgi:tetratricopeptide (TPR) repeat protein